MTFTWVTRRAASVYVGLAISTVVSATSATVVPADTNYVLHKDSQVDRGAEWRPISTTTAASFTTGSVLFAGPSLIAQDNANLFWDNTLNRLGIGTATPAEALEVVGTVKSTGLKMTTSPTTGHVLTSDSVGVGSWAANTRALYVFNTAFIANITLVGPVTNLLVAQTGYGGSTAEPAFTVNEFALYVTTTAGVGDSTFRIQDVTNAATLATITVAQGSALAIAFTTTFANIPAARAAIELQSSVPAGITATVRWAYWRRSG
jgi:hypothetical protein